MSQLYSTSNQYKIIAKTFFSLPYDFKGVAIKLHIINQLIEKGERIELEVELQIEG